MKTEKARRVFLEAKGSLSPRTLENYGWALDHLQRWCPKMPKKAEPVWQAMNRAGTIWLQDTCWRVWGVFFTWCRRQYGTANPMQRVGRPRVPQVEMRSLEPAQLVMVLAAADKLLDRCIIALALDCGVRGGEFGSLRMVDVGRDTLRLWGKGNKQTRVPISPDARDMLVALARERGGGPETPLFLNRKGQPMDRDGVYQRVQLCMERAGIPGPKLGPHCLRHSLGKQYIVSGGDPFTLQRVMRHRKLTTTQQYVHLAMRDVVEGHREHSPLRQAMKAAQGVLMFQEEGHLGLVADDGHPVSVETGPLQKTAP